MEALGTPTLFDRRVSEAKPICDSQFDPLTPRQQGTLTYRAPSGVSEAPPCSPKPSYTAR
jgi:hypothetical protein